jgi:hypothetical protein
MNHDSQYSFYFNTTDFRKTNSVILIGVMVLIVVILCC